MDLRIVNLHYHGYAKHMFVGLFSMGVSRAVLLPPFENSRKAQQLVASSWKSGAESPALTHTLFSVTYRDRVVCFLREFLGFTVKVLSGVAVDQKLEVPERLIGLVGSALGTLISYPLDSLRTLQAAQQCGTLAEPDPPSPLAIYWNLQFWRGLPVALCHSLAVQLLARNASILLQQHVPDSLYGSTLSIRLTQFTGLVAARFLFYPVETYLCSLQVAASTCKTDANITVSEDVESGQTCSTLGFANLHRLTRLYSGSSLVVAEAACVILVPFACMTVLGS